MDERVLQLRVGIFVLLAIIILLALIYLNSEVWKGQYTVFLKPQTAPGVKTNTPVRKNGVLIGRVRDVQTLDDAVTIALRIDNDERIYENEVASIGTESILGDAVIEILPVAPEERGKQLRGSDLINRVSIKRNPMEIVDVALNLESEISDTLSAIRAAAGSFDQTAQELGDAGSGITNLADSLQEIIDDEDSQIRQMVSDFRKISRKTETALDNFNRIFENVNEVIGDPEFKGRFNDAVASIPGIFEEVRGAVSDIRETVKSFRSVSSSADKNLKNLEPFTESLKTNGPSILSTVDESLGNIDDVFGEIQNAAKSLSNLQSKDSTIGKLLNESELYDETLEAVRNIREQTIKIEPLINDLRMFADSIARDPGQLGVRGAIRNRNAPTTGYKGSATGRERVIRQ